MGIPAQVLQAAEMAEELHSKMFTMNASSEDGDSTSTEDPDTEDTDDTEEAAEDTSTENYEDEDDDIEEQVPHDDDVEELRKFKARYLSLRGKYNAELPRLHQELKELKQSVFQKLEQQIDQRQQQQEVLQKPQEPDKLSAFKEEYGEDFVESLRALIQAEAEAKIMATIKPVQEQVSSVEDTQVKAAQQSFMGYLDETVKGDWKGLWEGKDPKFIEFLNQPDPSGLYTYGDLVQQYNNNWDADRLAKVFNTYLDSKQPPKQPKPEQPNPAKQAMVAPSRSTQHTAPKTTDKIIWTKDAIKDFEKNDRMGKYNPEQSKAMWEDLLSAVAENRVR